MLSTLVDNNELNSWNIFSTRHGVCLNIRFSNAEPGSHSPVYYRKQTPRQAKRNLDRAYTHRHGIAAAHSEANPTIPKEAVDCQNNAKTTPVPKKQDINMSTSKKRKINDASPETIRHHESISCLPISGVLPDTPETVKADDQLFIGPLY